MSEERILRKAGAWELAAAACFVVAVLSVAIGFVLTTDWLLNARLHPALHAIGIILLIVGIPLIILGGHFMDVGERTPPTLRVYIGAAPGVGKTWQMLEDAHALKRQRVDIVIAALETHGRFETAALADGLERVPMQEIEYRGVTLEEMNVDAVIARGPKVAIVDELAHPGVPGLNNRKRYEDVLELLNHGISVITAVNIQHIESLNEVVARTTGVRARETVPDYFFRRADEVMNVDVSVDTLRTRLRQGKIYGVEKIDDSLNNFFRKGNLSALRELAVRQAAHDSTHKKAQTSQEL